MSYTTQEWHRLRHWTTQGNTKTLLVSCPNQPRSHRDFIVFFSVRGISCISIFCFCVLRFLLIFICIIFVEHYYMNDLLELVNRIESGHTKFWTACKAIAPWSSQRTTLDSSSVTTQWPTHAGDVPLSTFNMATGSDIHICGCWHKRTTNLILSFLPPLFWTVPTTLKAYTLVLFVM